MNPTNQIRARLTTALLFAAEARSGGDHTAARQFAQIAADLRQRDTYCRAEIDMLDQRAQE